MLTFHSIQFYEKYHVFIVMKYRLLFTCTCTIFFRYNIYKNYEIKVVIVYFLIQKIMLGGGGYELKTA